MAEIKLIEEKDIENLMYRNVDWDVVMNGTPYQVIKAPGFVHTIGGRLDYGDGNCYWAYPLNAVMSYSNLVQFNGVPGARWGFQYTPTNYIRNKWDETSMERGRKLLITRNDEVFYDGFMTIHECLAYVLDNKLDEHPLDLNERDFDKKCVGRKIWYRSEPAIISRYIQHQACIMIKPDGMDEFTVPKEYERDEICFDEMDELKVEIFSCHIDWFR